MTLQRGATIGILGDGQLGRMLAQAAQRRGFKVHGFGQDRYGPLGQVTPYFTLAGFDDGAALTAFAEACDVVTSEFENVPLAALELTGCKPGAGIFALAQDRLKEKQAAAKIGLPTAPFFAVESLEQLQAVLAQVGGEGILKTRRMGYDGKGQWRFGPDNDVAAIWEETPKADLILEGLVDFAFETSALVARNAKGQVVTFPCGENVHRDGILYQSIVPGQVTPEAEATANTWAKSLANDLALEGLLALEFFVLKDGSLAFNEMAPRPHNSGHWTIEACDQSQFDMAVSAILNEDLRTPQQFASATMTNVLGNDIQNPISGPNTYWHDYGKAEPKAGRKMGHIAQLSAEGF